MRFCTKCGHELNDGDLFCANCGAKINDDSKPTVKDDDYYSNNYIYDRPKVSYKTHPCSKIALVLSILGFAIFGAQLVLVGIYSWEDNIPYYATTIFALLMLLLLTCSITALATGIPGFAISRKHGLKSGITIASFVLSIILASILFVLYVISEI